MNLYKDWTNAVVEIVKTMGQDAFWSEYARVEKQIYSNIIGSEEKVSGKLSELAFKYNVSPVSFMGFLDGVNSSLETPLALEELNEDSDIELDINYEKLYSNMVESGADFLYELPGWESVLSVEKRDEIRTSHKSTIKRSTKVGRNDPCPCGSGLKYKNCCGKQ